MSTQLMNDRSFFGETCSPRRYAHLRQCTEVVFDPAGALPQLVITIDLRRHVYLCDHVFGERSLVPATMIAEILFEALAWLTEEHLERGALDIRCCKLTDFSIERSLALSSGETLEARILFGAVTEDQDGAVRVPLEIVSPRTSASGQRLGIRRIARCVATVGREPSRPPEVRRPSTPFEVYSFPVRAFYEAFLPSLGPRFQRSTGRFGLDREGRRLVGLFDCADRERSFVEGADSAFLISPLGLDLCLQYNVLLSRLLLTRSRLPIGCAALRYYAAPPASGECAVLAQCLEIDDDVMRSDLLAIDGAGRVLLSMEGCLVRADPYHRPVSRAEFEAPLERHRQEASLTECLPHLARLPQ